MIWLQISGGTLALGLLVPVCRLYLSRWRYQVEAKRRGCGSLPDATTQGTLGIFAIYHIFKAVIQKRAMGSLVQWTDSAGNEIHTCRCNLVGDDLIFSRDPDNFKALAVTQVNDYDLGDARMEILEPILGTGVLNNRGEAWKHSRALLRPQFARESISDLEMEERHLNDIWPLLDKQVSKDGWTGVIDLQRVFFNMTFGTSIDFLLGHKINLQAGQIAQTRDSDDEAVEMSEHYRVGAAWSYIKFLFGSKHWMVPNWILQYHTRKVRGFFRPFIRKALDRVDAKDSLDSKNQARFILLEELAKSTRNSLELENEIIGVLAASRGTTAAMIAWTMYFLARDARVFDKLRTAVVSQFGMTPDGITLRGLESCEYLRFVTREALRLAPVTPVVNRSSLVDTTLPRGGGKDGMDPVFVPKGTDVRISMFAMFRRVDIWGPDAEEFRPERWAGRTLGFEFSPFSAGRRKCIGRKLAV